MAYLVSDDGRELLKDVKDFCENEIKEQVKEFDESGEWPKDIYDMAIEMQLSMMDVPEEYGGLGLSHIDQAAIVEEIAKADAGIAVTLNGNGLALKPVLIAGNEEQKQKCCDIIMNGGWGAFALTEPDAGYDAANSKTTAVRIIPVAGKKVGDMAQFGGLLGFAPIMEVNGFSSDDFVNRKGRIPAPIHSFKN